MGKLPLEFFKFALYLTVPAACAVYYTHPENLKKLVERTQYVVYPPEDKTPIKPEELAKVDPNFRALIESTKQGNKLLTVEVPPEKVPDNHVVLMPGITPAIPATDVSAATETAEAKKTGWRRYILFGPRT